MEFKDLLELYKQGKYEEVIDKASLTNDYNAIFLKIRSLFELSRFVEAFGEFKNNETTIIRNNFIEAIKLFIDILLMLNYGSSQILIQLGPYFDMSDSLNSEEQQFLKQIDNYIELRKRALSIKNVQDEVYYDEESLKGMLACSKPMEVSEAISYIRVNFFNDEKANDFLTEIKNILHKRDDFDVCYGLLFNQLVIYQDTDTYFFRKNGKYFQAIPSSLVTLFNRANEYLAGLFDLIEAKEDNILVKELLIRVIFMSYPYLAPSYFESLTSARAYLCAVYKYTTQVLKTGSYDMSKYNFGNIEQENIENFYKDICAACAPWNTFEYINK